MKWISLSLSLPRFPPAQADHFINVRVSLSCSLFVIFALVAFNDYQHNSFFLHRSNIDESRLNCQKVRLHLVLSFGDQNINFYIKNPASNFYIFLLIAA